MMHPARSLVFSKGSRDGSAKHSHCSGCAITTINRIPPQGYFLRMEAVEGFLRLFLHSMSLWLLLQEETMGRMSEDSV